MREYTIRDLKDFGINYLTGESCAISLRGLYDLTFKGVKYVETFFTIKLAEDSPSNWNPYVGKRLATKSIRLSNGQARDLLIGILAIKNDVVVDIVPKDGNATTWSHLYASKTVEAYNDLLDEMPEISMKYNFRFYAHLSLQ